MTNPLYCIGGADPAVDPAIEYKPPPTNTSFGGVTASRQGSGMVSNAAPSARPDEPEVDYDDGATDLYRKIEGKDWDGALQRLETHPQEAKMWVSRKEASSNKTRWRLLPIHATCIFRSPLALMEALISVFPDGAQMKDDQGMLPVHLACRNGASKGVVLMLLNAFPESAKVKDRKGRVPVELVEASASQNKEAVIVAMKRFQKDSKSGKRYFGSSKMRGSDSDNGPEVDYEHRTILFRLILKKDWAAATARANTFPDEAAIWIVTKGFNGNLRFLPLHKACVLGPPNSVVEALVAANVEGAKAKDQDGWLPIHCACFYGASEGTVNTLLMAYPKGAQCKDDEGRLPLHYASLKGAPQGVVDSLLTSFPKGSMSKDDEGRLPIHHACSKSAPEGVIDALLKASPKCAQSKDDQNRLPLHHACRKAASERVIRTLLRVYPRAAQIKDDQDKLPLHYACQNGASPNVVNLLLTTYPESINVKNGFGYTPLAEARALDSTKNEPTIKVLERFKKEQDKIKISSGENSDLEMQVASLTSRVLLLEQALGQVSNLGKDLQVHVKKNKDTHEVVSKFADKLAALDMGIDSPAVPSSPKARNESTSGKKTKPSPLRSIVLGQKSKSKTSATAE